MKENEYVTTAIRWRLPADGNNNAFLEKVNDKILSVGSQRKLYTFDHVINTSDQKKVYEIIVEPLVEKSLEGYDCTFLASGQTGSGKTYTMGFESNANMNSENSGMTPRVMNYIFSCGKAVQTSISFVEVYNDQAFDLLGQNPREAFYKKDHRAREPTKKSVQNDCEVHAILAQGTKNRRVRGTKMNSTSSRSHAVFTIYLGTESSDHERRESVINLVDLAGSECVRKTGATGEAHAEGKSINTSLSAFNRVLDDLSKGFKRVSYRDSLITYILRDSLKTDCYFTLLGCVSPFESDSGETKSTLNFVAGAKQIKRTPQLNAIINEFQKSNTPVKTPHQKSNASFPSTRLPSPLIAPQNNSRRLSKRLMTDQPRSKSTTGNSISQRRFTTSKQPISNSTAAKRASLSTIRNMRASTVGVKSTHNYSVASRTTSRKNLEKAMRSDESINWNKASSAMDNDYRTFDSSPEKRAMRKPIIQSGNEDVLNIVKSLENVIREEMTGGKELNRAAITDMLGQLKIKLNAQDPSIDVSFCPASTATSIQMLSTVVEDIEAVSVKDAGTNESNVNMISSSGLVAERNNLVEQIASVSPANDPVKDLDSAVKITMNYDHIENKMLFNVEENTSHAIQSGTQKNVYQNTSQVETVQQCNSLAETTPDGNLSANAQRRDESNEAIVSSTTIFDSPKIPKRIPNENVRTPIGKLIIRKVAPACDFESTRYAVEMINRTRQPLQVPMDYADFCGTPMRTSNTLTMSTAMKKNPHRLPLSPRMVLNRIETLQQCPISQPTKRRVESEIKSKVKRTKIPRTVVTRASEKFILKPRKPDERQRILDILNTGSGKDLQKLSKVGSKTADRILNYRNVQGPLESIEELVNIGWSTNMCQKFIAANIF